MNSANINNLCQLQNELTETSSPTTPDEVGSRVDNTGGLNSSNRGKLLMKNVSPTILEFLNEGD